VACAAPSPLGLHPRQRQSVLPAAAQSGDDAAAEGVPNLPARSERLDIYGAGMCHTCEWRPRAKVMAAAEQCGTEAGGAAKSGLFECGRNPACEPVCNFVRCGSE